MADTLPMHTDVAASAHALSARAVRGAFDDLGARVNAAIKDTGLTLSAVADQPKGHALFSHPRAHLSVVTHRGKMPRSVFASALASPITKARLADYDHLFASHAGYVTLDVGHGPAPGETTSDPLPLVLRLRVLKGALDALIDTVPVSLVHWVQSDMVFVPAELALWQGRDLPFSLVIHPLPRPARADSDGAAGLGMVAGYSEHLLGKTLYLDPMPRDQATGFRQMVSMLHEHHEGRIRLAHGDTLELSDGTLLYVRHEKAETADTPGRICVGLTPPQAPAATATDASGFEDRLSRLKSVARGQDRLAIDIQDKVTEDARPRKGLLSRLLFPLMVRGAVVPAVLLVLYYSFATVHRPVSVATALPQPDTVQQIAIDSIGTGAQGTAQP